MKLKVKQTLFIGLAFLSLSMFWQVYDSIIPKILINTFGLNQTYSGVIMAFDNILALFLLPFFGHLSDKTSTKYGKRTPFIVIGTLLVVGLVSILAVIDGVQINLLEANNIAAIVKDDYIIDGVFNESAYQAAIAVRQSQVLSITKSNIYLLFTFIGILLLILFSLSFYRTPTIALMPDVTPKPLRSQANAIINLMGSAGGILALVLISRFSQDYSYYLPLFIIVAIIMFILLIVFLVGTNEKKMLEEFESEDFIFESKSVIESDAKIDKKVRVSFIMLLVANFLWFMGYNALTTKFSIYTQNMLGMDFVNILVVSQIAAFVFYLPVGLIASKYGRKKTIIGGIVVMVIACIIGYFASPSLSYLIYISMVLAGIAWAAIVVNSYPMFVEMTKCCSIGRFTGYYFVVAMLGQSITPIFSGFLMDKFGMQILFPYCGIFVILSLVAIMFVKYGDSNCNSGNSILEGFDYEE